MSIAEQFMAALNALPDSPAKIADYLIDRGIRGHQGESCACPLARYLRQELNIPYAEINGDVIVYDGFGNRYEDELPDAALNFVYDFDAGYYAELIDETPLTSEEKWGNHYEEDV